MTRFLYLGCLIPIQFPEVEKATRDTLERLKIEYSDMNRASCCMPPGLFGFHKESWLRLNRRNLSLANDTVITPCDECFASLQDARAILIEEAKNIPEIKPFPQLIAENLGAAKEAVQRNLGLKCAVQQSCHLLRPSQIRKIDDPESPSLLGELLRNIGCVKVDCIDELACCGGLVAEYTGVGLKLGQQKAKAFAESGADCIVTTCAHCLRQLTRVNHTLPIFHLAQLYALAFGSKPSLVGIPRMLKVGRR